MNIISIFTRDKPHNDLNFKDIQIDWIFFDSLYYHEKVPNNIEFKPLQFCFFALGRKCQHNIGFSQFASRKWSFTPAKKMPTQNRLFSIGFSAKWQLASAK